MPGEGGSLLLFPVCPHCRPVFSLDFLATLRAAELDLIAAELPTHGRVLELGAGTGSQARALADRGFDITAVDVAWSNYRENRVFPVVDYDGRHLPFADASFDAVFSSNVLEHVPDVAVMNQEIRRVLRRDGVAVHLMPTPVWRWWTTWAAFPAALQEVVATWRTGDPAWQALSTAQRAWRRVRRSAYLLLVPWHQRRHGERGSLWTELWYFRPAWWREQFTRDGFRLVNDAPAGLFYTGQMVVGPACSIGLRRRLATILGSACHRFRVSPQLP
jgi:SAM-dependent methyltransferase